MISYSLLGEKHWQVARSPHEAVTSTGTRFLAGKAQASKAGRHTSVIPPCSLAVSLVGRPEAGRQCCLWNGWKALTAGMQAGSKAACNLQVCCQPWHRPAVVR